MIKHINTGVAELIAVKVPTDSFNFSVEDSKLFYTSSFGPLNTVGRMTKIPKGNYQLLGIAHELTEEVWDSVLPEARRLYFDTPSISGLSLLEVNEVYAVNPYGEESRSYSEVMDGADVFELKEDMDNWTKAQQNVGTWVLLKKIEE